MTPRKKTTVAAHQVKPADETLSGWKILFADQDGDALPKATEDRLPIMG